MINTSLVKELMYFKVFVSIPPFPMIQDFFLYISGARLFSSQGNWLSISSRSSDIWVESLPVPRKENEGRIN